MECKKVRKNFKVVGLKGKAAFTKYGTEVPKLAQQLLACKEDIKTSDGTEIALFEAKRDASHVNGQFFVGLIVNGSLLDVPNGMEYIETDQDYVSIRGKIQNISHLHTQLLNWLNEQGYERNLEAYIVETYHPTNDGEDVEIFLPIYS